MKKVFLMLVAVATVALVSCGGSKEEKKATTDGAAKTEKVSKVKQAANADEAGLALCAELNDAVDLLKACESPEDVKTLVQALSETMDELNQEYPDYQPDAETEKALGEACTAVGEAIGAVGVNLGMDASDIEQLQKMLDK